MRLPLRWSLRSWSHGLDHIHSLEYVLQPKMLWPKCCQIQSFFNPHFSVSHYILKLMDHILKNVCFPWLLKQWLFWFPLLLTSPSVLAFLFVLWNTGIPINGSWLNGTALTEFSQKWARHCANNLCLLDFNFQWISPSHIHVHTPHTEISFNQFVLSSFHYPGLLGWELARGG